MPARVFDRMGGQTSWRPPHRQLRGGKKAVREAGLTRLAGRGSGVRGSPGRARYPSAATRSKDLLIIVSRSPISTKTPLPGMTSGRGASMRRHTSPPRQTVDQREETTWHRVLRREAQREGSRSRSPRRSKDDLRARGARPARRASATPSAPQPGHPPTCQVRDARRIDAPDAPVELTGAVTRPRGGPAEGRKGEIGVEPLRCPFRPAGAWY